MSSMLLKTAIILSAVLHVRIHRLVGVCQQVSFSMALQELLQTDVA